MKYYLTIEREVLEIVDFAAWRKANPKAFVRPLTKEEEEQYDHRYACIVLSKDGMQHTYLAELE